MATNKVSVVFEALVGGTTKATFATLNKGFREFAKGLKESAKQLSVMQQTQAADALGHVAMQMDRLTKNLSQMSHGTTDAKTKLQSLENGFKTLLATEGENAEAAKKVIRAYKDGNMTFKNATKELGRLNTITKIAAQSEEFLANESAQVNAKWKQLIPTIRAGNVSFNTAVTRSKNFGKAIQNLAIAVKEGGGNVTAFERSMEALNVSNVKAANGIKLVGSQFKISNAEGYKALNLTNENIRAIKKQTNSYSFFEKALNSVGPKQALLSQALDKAGKAYQNNQIRLDTYAQNLLKAEKAINGLNGQVVRNSSVSSNALKNIDRFNIATQLEAKNLQLAARGFTVLNNEGLKPFGNLTFTAAGNLKMLGGGFTSLVSKEEALAKLTGKTTAEIRLQTTAMWEAGKSIQQINSAHQKSLTSLSKSVAQYEKMKQAASKLRQVYADTLKPLNALTASQKKSQDRMQLWLGQMAKGKGNLQSLTIAINKEAKAFTAQTAAMEKSKTAASNLSRTHSTLLKQTDSLTTSQQKNQTQINLWLKALQQGKGDVKILSDAVGKAAKNFKAEAIAVEKSKKAHTDNVTQARILARDFKTLTHNTGTLTEAQRKLRTESVKLVSAVKNGTISYQDARSKMRGLGKAFAEAHPQASLFERALTKVTNSLKTYSSYMISSQALMQVSNAFSIATDAIIEHDQSLHNLKAIMNATGTETRLLDQTLVKTAQATRFSLGEVGAAMIKLGQAGFTASETMAGMDRVAQLATGSMETLEETVNLVSTAVRVFSLGMDQTGMVADVFANAVNDSRLTLHKLNIAFNYVGPLAKAAGIGIKDTTASLELLANAGVRASTTGTGFRRVLAGLMNPSTELAKAIEAAGYQVQDFNPLMTDFGTIVERLPEVVKNAGDSISMFGVRGSAVVSAFAEQGSVEFNRLRNGLNDVGSAARMSEEQMKGLQYMLKNVGDRLGTFASVLVRGPILAGFKAFINLIRGTLSAMTALADNGIARTTAALGVLVTAFAGISTAVRVFLKLGLLKFLKTNAIAMVAFTGAILQGKVAMAGTIAPTTKLATAVGVLTTGIKAATAAMRKFVANPIGGALTAIVVGVTGVVTALNYYAKTLKETQEEQSTLASGINAVNESFDKYEKAVQKYGAGSKEATNAADTLQMSAKRLGKTHKELKDLTDEFTDSIDEETGVVYKSTEALSEYNDVLRDEYVQANLEAANATAKLYEKQSFISGSIDKLGSAIGWVGQYFYDGMIQPLKNFIAYLGRLGDIIFNVVGKYFPNLAKGLSWLGERWGDFTDMVGYGVNSMNEARKRFSELQEAFESGDATDKQVETFNQLSKNAAAVAKEIFKSGKSLEEYLKVHDELEPMVIAALEVAYNKLANATDKASTSQLLFKQILDDMKDEVATVYENGADSIETMMSVYDKYVSKVTEQAHVLHAAQTQLWEEEKGAYRALKGDEQQQDEMYLEHLKGIYLQMYSSYEKVLNKQKAYLAEVYSLEIANLSTYFENKNALSETQYANEKALLDEALQKELKAIKRKNLSEKEEERKLWDAKTGHFAVHLQRAESHAKEIMKLAEQEYQDQKAVAEATITDEEERQQKIIDLNQDMYDAKTESLENLRDEYTNYIDDLKSEEESLTDTIQSELEEREDFEKTIEEKIRDLKWKTLDDEELLEAKKTLAYKKAREARMVALEGEHSETKEYVEEAIAAWEDYASTLNKDAPDYEYRLRQVQAHIKDLGGVWTDSAQKSESANKRQLKSVKDDLGASQEKVIEITGKIQAFNEEKAAMGDSIDFDAAMTDIKEFSDFFDKTMDDKQVAIDFVESIDGKPVKEQIEILSTQMEADLEKKRETHLSFFDEKQKILDERIEELVKQLDDMVLEREAQVLINGADGKPLENKISSLDHELDTMARDRTMTLTVKKKTVSSSNNDEEDLATGGKLPGYGGGDIIPANLEPGEFVMRKESVKKYGADLMHSLNNGLAGPMTGIPKRKGYAYGGEVSDEYQSERYDEDDYKEEIQFRKEPEEILEDFWSLVNDNVDTMQSDIFNAHSIGDVSPYLSSPMTGPFEGQWLTSGSERPVPDDADDLLNKYFGAAKAFNSQIGYNGATFSYEPVLSKKLKAYMDLFNYDDFGGYQGLFEEDALEKISAQMSEQKFATGGLVGAIRKFAEGGEVDEPLTLTEKFSNSLSDLPQHISSLATANSYVQQMNNYLSESSSLIEKVKEKFGFNSFIEKYGEVQGYADGGGVRQKFQGGGSLNPKDTVPAMLEPGEFVMKKTAVQQYGSNLMHSLNSGLAGPIKGYAEGGFVSDEKEFPTGVSIDLGTYFGKILNWFEESPPEDISYDNLVDFSNLIRHTSDHLNQDYDYSGLNSIADKLETYRDDFLNATGRRITERETEDALEILLEKARDKIASDRDAQFGTEEGSFVNVDTWFDNLKAQAFRFGGAVRQKFALGGIAQNMRDTVPAMLEPGEFVMKKASVLKYGQNAMESLNNGTIEKPQGYADGGMVGSGGSTGQSMRTGERHEVVLNVGGQGYTFEGDRNNVDGFLGAIKRAKGAA